jgi:hypothetical protein
MVNGGVNFTNHTVRLANNIDLVGKPWNVPIGNTSANSFNGTFDGGGYFISNLGGSTGLFGYVGTATIKNVILENVNINATTTAGGIGMAGHQGMFAPCFIVCDIAM